MAAIALFVALANTAVGQLERDGDGGGTVKVSAQQASLADILQPGSITARYLAKGAVTGAKINSGAVTAQKIQPQSIGASQIAPLSLGQSLLAPGAVGFANLQQGSVFGSALAQGGIGASAYGLGSIGQASIGDSAIGFAQMAPDSIGGPQIRPDSIVGGKISPFAIDTQHIANSAISFGKMQPNSIGTATIQNNAITQGLLANNSVGTSNVQPFAINGGLLANNSVGTQQLSSAIPAAAVQNTAITCRDTNTLSGNHYATELFDTANMFPGGTGSADYSVRAPVNGIYQVTASQVWAGDSTGGTRSMEFDGRQADGSTPFGPLGSSTVPANTGGPETFQTLTGLYKLTAGQSVELWTGANNLTGDNPGCPGGPNNTSFGNTGSRASTLTMTFLNKGP
jgi:hypothetical protein